MQNQEAYFKTLLSGFIDNKLSMKEVEELLAFIKSQPDSYNHLLNTQEIKDKLNEQAYNHNIEISEAVSSRMKARLMAAIQEDEATEAFPSPQVSHHERKPLLRQLAKNWHWIAAAAVLIAITTATFLSVDRQSGNTEVAIAKSTKTEILPGGNKATLRLANGQIITLDSAANGSLATQGNAKIVKLSNGQVVYTVEGKVATEVMYNTMSTPNGGQFKLKLPDGTDVWLNAASSITYPTAFVGKNRIVTVTGEVYFEVAKDKSKPFHVKVNDMDVEVLGTHFNINSYPDESNIKTTLLEGSVKVSMGKSSKMLSPGQQAVAVPSDQTVGNKGSIEIKNNVDIEQAIAWKNGLFNFSKVSLPEVMRQIARWYDVEIEYRGQIKPKKFGGEIQRDLSLPEVLEGLRETGIHYRIEGRKLIVLT